MNFIISSFDFASIFKTIKTRWYYYIALAVFLVLLVLFFSFKKQKSRNNLTKTQKLCYSAVLTALATLFNIIDIPISDLLQLSLVGLIGFISSYLLSGGYGFVVCFLGDLLGSIIMPHGPYNPIIGIGSGLFGLIPALVFDYTRLNKYVKTAISFVLCFLIISAGINTVGFCLMYPTRYTFEILALQLPAKFVAILINMGLSMVVVTIFPKIMPKNKFNLS